MLLRHWPTACWCSSAHTVWALRAQQPTYPVCHPKASQHGWLCGCVALHALPPNTQTRCTLQESRKNSHHSRASKKQDPSLHLSESSAAASCSNSINQLLTLVQAAHASTPKCSTCRVYTPPEEQHSGFAALTDKHSTCHHKDSITT